MAKRTASGTHVGNAFRIAVLAGIGMLAGCRSGATMSEGSTAIPAPVPSGKASVQNVPHLVSADLETSIRRHIDEQKAANAGLFPIRFEDREIKLKLVRVHTEYLGTIEDDLHFACVDLATEDGNVYDVDFFLRGEASNAVVTETMVHKLNGKPYFVWEQEPDQTWVRKSPDEADASLLGVLHGQDEFDFFYQATVPEIKQHIQNSGTARMWVPVASSDEFQQVQVVKIVAPGSSRMVQDQIEGNRVMVVDLEPSDSGKPLEITYRVRRFEKSAYKATRESAQKYLGAEARVPDNDRFKQLAARHTAGKETTLEKARALYDHTIDEIKYMKYGPGWGQGDAMYACDAKSGNCTDFHAYFIALCRASGIPARFAIGASIPSERNDGSMDGYHCWAEFYADGRWWPVDISEADKFSSLTLYYFGHHPANRFEFSRGRDLIVDPMPKTGPINFLAYPLLEINGEVTKVKTVFGFKRLGD